MYFLDSLHNPITPEVQTEILLDHRRGNHMGDEPMDD